MKNHDQQGANNFRPLDNSVRTSLRYQIEAEKQLEAFSNAFNRRYSSSSEGATLFNFIGSLLRGIYYLISGILFLLFKKKRK